MKHILTALIACCLILGQAAPVHALDLTVTAANVSLVSGSKQTKDSAEAITAGQVVYLLAAGTVGVATNNDAAKDVIVGVALNDCASGQPCTYATDGAVVGFGAILTTTEVYVLSASGAISPIADKATSDYVSILGYGATTSNMQLRCISMSLQAP